MSDLRGACIIGQSEAHCGHQCQRSGDPHGPGHGLHHTGAGAANGIQGVLETGCTIWVTGS